MKSWYIPRRTLLRTAGTSIALPALEAMIKPGPRAAVAPPPRRFLAVHGQVYGFVSRPDPVQRTPTAPWTPKTPVAAGTEAGPSSAPLDRLESNTYLKPFFDKK